MSSLLTVNRLSAADKEDWSLLWQGYLDFYETTLTPEVSDETFARLVAGEVMAGAIARAQGGRAVGFVNWLWHAGTWGSADHLYLEDLYVATDARGAGTGRALITFVADDGRERGADKVYWHTQRANANARRLYDAIARDTGYMQYEIAL